MYTRIASDPAVLGGKPVVKGMRMSVEFHPGAVRIGCDTRRRLEDLPVSDG
jgi:uncharacterized protein (DUF433 family)